MVYILLADGFEEAEALVPADLLRRAEIETALVSVTGRPVSGGHGIVVQCDQTLEQVKLSDAQMVVLPGGGKGVEHLGQEPQVETLVRQAADSGVQVAAICAAPTLLDRWGLLEGKQAVCYPTLTQRMTGAQLREEKVVQDGGFITGQAAGAAFQFGLRLVEVLAGAETAQRVQQEIYL